MKLKVYLWIDSLTGEIISETPRATIFPKTHYVTPREKINACIPDIEEELKEQTSLFKGK